MPKPQVYDPNQSAQNFLEVVKYKQAKKRQSEKDKLEREMFEFTKKKYDAEQAEAVTEEGRKAAKEQRDIDETNRKKTKHKQGLIDTIRERMKDSFLEGYPIDADENEKQKYMFMGIEKFGGALNATKEFKPEEITRITNNFAAQGTWQAFEKRNKDYWGKEEKTPTTAMAAYIKQNPNATSDEILKYSQDLKKPTKKADIKFDVKIDKIDKRMVDLESLKLKAKTTKGLSPLDMLMYKDDPKMMEQMITADPKDLINLIDTQLEDLKKRRQATEEKFIKQKFPTAKFETPVETGEEGWYVREDDKLFRVEY